MQLPGLQMASCSKYSHLFYLSEVEEDGKPAADSEILQANTVRNLQGAVSAFAWRHQLQCSLQSTSWRGKFLEQMSPMKWTLQTA